ncbi:hypothetical protein Pelo_19398 [Pelomyxa schiedti]|nr:hypothetical protein Pelo_19398 [Pelomyxa schiedti]
MKDHPEAQEYHLRGRPQNRLIKCTDDHANVDGQVTSDGGLLRGRRSFEGDCNDNKNKGRSDARISLRISGFPPTA